MEYDFILLSKRKAKRRNKQIMPPGRTFTKKYLDTAKHTIHQLYQFPWGGLWTRKHGIYLCKNVQEMVLVLAPKGKLPCRAYSTLADTFDPDDVQDQKMKLEINQTLEAILGQDHTKLDMLVKHRSGSVFMNFSRRDRQNWDRIAKTYLEGQEHAYW